MRTLCSISFSVFLLAGCSTGSESSDKTPTVSSTTPTSTTPTNTTPTNTVTTTTTTTAPTTTYTSTTTATTTLGGDVLTGKTYLLRYSDLTYTDPSNLQSTLAILELEVGIDYIMVQVEEVDTVAEELLAVAATGYDDDTTGGGVTVDCGGAVRTSPADFSDNPTFVLGPEKIDLPLSKDTIITLEDFRLEGTFNKSGDAITDVIVTGGIDTRPLGVTCSLIAFLSEGTCGACEDGALECLQATAIADNALANPAVDILTECGL